MVLNGHSNDVCSIPGAGLTGTRSSHWVMFILVLLRSDLQHRNAHRGH